VNRLRDDVERSAKRIAKLEQKMEQLRAQRSAPIVPALPDPTTDS
jgi:ubiquinone biosynthesis protein UbiJ